MPLTRTRSDAGVSRLWARARIDALEDQLRRGTDEALVRPQVIEVAVAHRLVTRYTSLVAVDRTPVRAPDSPLASVQVANGATGDALALAQGATPAPLWFALGVAGLLLMALARRGQTFAGARA
jgi:Ca-activated chloride channel family protein